MASKIKMFVKQKTQEGGVMHKVQSAIARSKSIDHQLDEDRERKQKEVQLLVLGGASSGKSTFIKQLRIHHGDGFPIAERSKHTGDIYENVSDALNLILDHVKEFEGQYSQQENEVFARSFQEMFPRWRHRYITKVCASPVGASAGMLEAETVAVPCGVTQNECTLAPDYIKLRDYSAQILALWRDVAVRNSLLRKHEFEPPLVPAEEYFLEHMSRLLTPAYVPTMMDVLYIRKPTLGVQEHAFVSDGLSYRVIDVAGQMNQRKKWIHFFDNVTAVFFFVSLSGYCETLEEDAKLNSLEDSLASFKEVVHNSFLVKTDFILFLNKRDLFEQRIKSVPLNVCFHDYKDSDTVNEALTFIKDQFTLRQPKDKTVYTHVSCAIDTELMRCIIRDVMNIIVEINLRKANMPL